MRYLAAFLSFFMHILFVLLLFRGDGPVLEQKPNVLGLELVSLRSESEKGMQPVAAHEPVKRKTQSEQRPPSIKTNKHSRIKSKAAHGKKAVPETGAVQETAKNDAAHTVKRTTVPPKSFAQADVPRVEPHVSSSSNAVVLRQGKGITIGNSTIVLKRGSESRSLDSIAGYSFDENDFRGHYETYSGRQVVIIDDRKEHGRLVLHDHKTGLTRRLKKAGYGDFIYTYGPSFDEDEPVEGSVVFLPGDEHWIHRFMWLPAAGAAEYPVKERVDAMKENPEIVDENLFVPAHAGKYPAVILARFGKEIAAARFSEVARHLCGQGVVVLVVDDMKKLTLIKAVDRLKRLSQVDSRRIGFWARGYQPGKIPRIPRHAGRFGFVILTIDCPEASLYPERFASVIPEGVPLFVGLRNVSVDWKSVVSVVLAGIPSTSHQLTILDDDPFQKKGSDSEIDWIDSLSGDFVSSISDWLDSQ